MLNSLHPSWRSFFDENLNLPDEYYKEIEGKVIYPPQELIFNAFTRDLNDIKVVLIGQDCYHNSPKQAMGLAFSVPKGVEIPPSLWNLFREMKADLNIEATPSTGDLTPWADQGVFLINSALTVEQKRAGSHLKYWEPFTDLVIKYLSNVKPDLVYILLGNYARKKKGIIGSNAKVIIEATHPSPLGANQGGFFGSKIFSRTNDALIEMGKAPITWKLP